MENWKYKKLEWIMNTPIPCLPFTNVWDEFEQDFLEDWKDILAPEKAAIALTELRMKGDRVDEYIS